MDTFNFSFVLRANEHLLVCDCQSVITMTISLFGHANPDYKLWIIHHRSYVIFTIFRNLRNDRLVHYDGLDFFFR